MQRWTERGRRGPHPGHPGTRNAPAPVPFPVEVVGVAAALIVMVASNALLEVLHLGELRSAAADGGLAWSISPRLTLLVWALVCIGLAIWVAGAVRRAFKPYDLLHPPLATLTAALFVASCALNVAFVALWRHNIHVAAVLASVVLWLIVCAIYIRERSTDQPSRWMPFSLYGAWVSVSVAASLARALSDGGILAGTAASLAFSLASIAVLMTTAFFARRLGDDYIVGVVALLSGIVVGARMLDRSIAMGVVMVAATLLAGIAACTPWESLFASRAPGGDGRDGGGLR